MGGRESLVSELQIDYFGEPPYILYKELVQLLLSASSNASGCSMYFTKSRANFYSSDCVPEESACFWLRDASASLEKYSCRRCSC
jgi:hypothetical protein